MREIKFRGLTLKSGWATGLLAKIKSGTYISNSAGAPLAFEVNPDTVGEYTGLKDQNGVEIYEGDIVDNRTGTYNGAVIFENGCFQHRKSPLGFFVEDGEVEDNRDDYDSKITLQVYNTAEWAVVIGNIYENPELLESEASHA